MLAGALERARGVGAPLSVALLDLDHFKHFNDVHGHLAGDRLLRAAGAGWRPLLGLGETVARWGGEEFAVLLPGRSLESAGDLLEQLRVHAPAGVTVSAGVARWDGHESARELMERADVALYQAKRTGRDRVALAGEPASAVLR
jgi:diguanylate cyclase (GGDEF)-like protein